MNFSEFVNNVEDNIRKYLPEKYNHMQVDIHIYEKLNEKYTGLTIHGTGSHLSPVINLEAFYNEYLEGRSFDDVMKKISEVLEMDVPSIKLDSLLNFENAKENLFITLNSIENNENFLTTVPHTIVEDMAITYHLAIDVEGDQISSTTVTNSLLNQYGVDKETLHQAALNNSEKIFPMQMDSLNDFISRTFIEDMKEMGMSDEKINEMLEDFPKTAPDFTILSNDIKVNGAAVLFYPETMDKVAEAIGGSYYLIPSSKHEFLIVPNEGENLYEQLFEMVTGVNEAMVKAEDKLTDQIYHYDAEDKVFEIASKFETRMAEKSKENSMESNHSLLNILEKKKTEVKDTGLEKKTSNRKKDMEI